MDQDSSIKFFPLIKQHLILQMISTSDGSLPEEEAKAFAKAVCKRIARRKDKQRMML